MDSVMLQLSKQMEELDKVIQPYKWSNSSAEKIRSIFDEMNNIVDRGEKLATGTYAIRSKGRPKGSKNKPKEIAPTKLEFPVPDEKRPNQGLWEGCVAYYLDALTKAISEKDERNFHDAIYSLIDVGKAYDREMDPNTTPEDMLRDESLRADSAKCEYWRKLKYPDFQEEVKDMLKCRDEPPSKVDQLRKIVDVLSGIHEPNTEVDVDAERAEALKLIDELNIV